ncbi:hypothetical protein [Pseudomonas syringae group sp. J254-4]|uniref:hypothetical protein n=1 Tax=Pseudomonas syringae group sp. J254-4 TaxID=3079589 RepID=UPI00290ADF6F|nr:hypothetical protein [Pseudomonas syringae group sp. J254-4]MDU8454798.1 hypothetical protein [Pseudomonas syringae group sp. J254-4]
MPFVITDHSWWAVSEEFDVSLLAEGESFVAEIPDWLREKVAADEIRRDATNLLNTRIRNANDQVFAINGRISNLNWLINIQDPEEMGDDYEAPTQADIDELASLRAPLNKWNSYLNKLTKVAAQAGWPTDPAWPVAPAPYVLQMARALADIT